MRPWGRNLRYFDIFLYTIHSDGPAESCMSVNSVMTPDRASASRIVDDPDLRFQSLSTFPLTPDSTPDAVVAHWVRGYLMRPHAELGRAGAVCPFTSASSRLDLLLVGSSRAKDEEEIFAIMGRAIEAFESISCPSEQRQFRAVIVAFPQCVGGEGRARLKAVQNRLRPESIYRGKMIGLFDPQSPDRGLINPAFRPLRAPVPLLAIRMLVEGDAPFVLRNPRLTPIYLIKFPFKGPLRLWSALWR